MALTPYNTRREYQSGQANQDGWEYPWTPTNNTSPVFSNPGQSVSPSLRRAVPAQVPSTPIRSNGPPIVYSPTYRAAPTPWGVNATPIAYPETMVTPQNVPWTDWGHSSQGNVPPQGDLQPALSFNSVATSSNTGVDDPTPTGGEDDHRCGPASHANHHQPSQLKCQWVGCTYSGVFTRETCLWRHIKSVHVSPGMYACTYPQCNKAFGRKDKFLAHLRQAHMTPGGHCPACHP